MAHADHCVFAPARPAFACVSSRSTPKCMSRSVASSIYIHAACTGLTDQH